MVSSDIKSARIQLANTHHDGWVSGMLDAPRGRLWRRMGGKRGKEEVDLVCDCADG